MYSIRIFEYKRGETFSCNVCVNEWSGAIVFNSIVTPDNTPQAVKEAFLDEAEVAALKLVGDNVTYLYGD